MVKVNALTDMELAMMKEGYDNLSLIQKNRLIMEISAKLKKPVMDIDESTILNHHKSLRIELLSTRCNNLIVEGFESSNGHTYRTDRDDQINMIGQKDMLHEDQTIEEVYWRTEDAGYLPHTREEWLNVYKEAFRHKQEKIFKYNKLKSEVMNAETHSEILAIKWDEYDELPAYEQ